MIKRKHRPAISNKIKTLLEMAGCKLLYATAIAVAIHANVIILNAAFIFTKKMMF